AFFSLWENGATGASHSSYFSRFGSPTVSSDLVSAHSIRMPSAAWVLYSQFSKINRLESTILRLSQRIGHSLAGRITAIRRQVYHLPRCLSWRSLYRGPKSSGSKLDRSRTLAFRVSICSPSLSLARLLAVCQQRWQPLSYSCWVAIGD